MKKRPELDVDFIGGQTPLTVEEEKALNDFFRKKKSVTKKSSSLGRKTESANRVKLTA